WSCPPCTCHVRRLLRVSARLQPVGNCNTPAAAISRRGNFLLSILVMLMIKATDWESRIGRRVRLRDLHALSAVIQSGSMAKAAKELGVTQSAVSQMIADLEAALRVRLLDRSPRGVVATIYGDILLRRSRAALDELKQGIQEIEFLTDHARGQVRVGCPESISSAVLPPIAELFLERFPRATLDVDNVNLGALSPLLERDIDLVIARGGRGFLDQPISDDLAVQTLFEDELV